MKKFLHEYRHFLSYPRDMRVLLITNLVYGLVMPVIEMFIGAYVMRKSDDVKMVVIYQLAVYTEYPSPFWSTAGCCNSLVSNAFTPSACCSAGSRWWS